MPGFAATVSKGGVPEGASGTTSYTVEQDLQPTTLFYWRSRAVQGTSTGPWSPTARLKSKLVGFNRAGELYDPLIHGETVGERVGSTDFVPGKGIRLNPTRATSGTSCRRRSPNGEFSMEVEGLRANGPGDKAKVFGMQEGQDDYITNRYRVDIQYRGTDGFPANAISSACSTAIDPMLTSVRARHRRPVPSVFLLDPSTAYYWKFTWGRENGEVRTVLKEGGITGTTTLYNEAAWHAERPVYAKSALCLPRRADRPQRL